MAYNKGSRAHFLFLCSVELCSVELALVPKLRRTPATTHNANMKKLALVGICLSLIAPVAVARDVLEVDANAAAGVYTEIRLAVADAVDGDIILVASGTYQPFLIANKSIVVAERTNAQVIVQEPVTVRGLDAGKEVVLHGLTIDARFFNTRNLAIEDCEGHVQVQDTTIFGNGNLLVLPSGLQSMVVVENSSAVTFVDCSFDSRPKYSVFAGQVERLDGVAALAIDSNLFIYGSEFFGSDGFRADSAAHPGVPGFAALELFGGSVLSVGSNFVGGIGGDGHTVFGNTDGGAGGSGIRLSMGRSAPSAVAHNTTLTGGMGGVGSAPAVSGVTGDPVEIIAGTFTAPSPSASVRTIKVDPIASAGQTILLQFTGEPLDLLWLMVATDVGSLAYVPELQGTIHPGGPTFFFQFLGKLNAMGKKSTLVQLMPTGIDFVPVYMQALTNNATDGFVTSNPRFMAFLD